MPAINSNKQLRTLFPYTLAVCRALCSPLLFYLTILNQKVWVISVFLLLIFSDYIDGYLLRQLGRTVKSPLLAYLDPIADFLIIIAMFNAFVENQIYPAWILIFIGALFFQFLVTSRFPSLRYDPVGKYSGAFFYGVILITLLCSLPSFCSLLLYGMIIFGVIALLSRFFFLIQPFCKKEN